MRIAGQAGGIASPIHRDAGQFKGLIDMWDVINEGMIMPAFDKCDNAVPRNCNGLSQARPVRTWKPSPFGIAAAAMHGARQTAAVITADSEGKAFLTGIKGDSACTRAQLYRNTYCT